MGRSPIPQALKIVLKIFSFIKENIMICETKLGVLIITERVFDLNEDRTLFEKKNKE